MPFCFNIYQKKQIKKSITEQKPVTKRKKPRKKRNRESEKQEQVCEECGKTVRNLKDHMYIHKPVFMRKRYKCKGCDKMFSTFSARLKHYKTKHLGIKKHCNECNKGEAMFLAITHNNTIVMQQDVTEVKLNTSS